MVPRLKGGLFKSHFDHSGRELIVPYAPLVNLASWNESQCLDPQFDGFENREISSFPFLSPIFARRLFEEVQNFCAVTGDSGVALQVAHMGLDHLIEGLVRSRLQRVADFGDFFLLPKVMRYDFEEDQTTKDWPKHIDGDIATINVCLGSQFEGGELCFDENVEFPHRTIGHAVMHSGTLAHRVKPITSGCRITLIIKVEASSVD